MLSFILRNSFHNKKASQDKGSNGTHMPFFMPSFDEFWFSPIHGFEFDYNLLFKLICSQKISGSMHQRKELWSLLYLGSLVWQNWSGTSKFIFMIDREISSGLFKTAISSIFFLFKLVLKETWICQNHYDYILYIIATFV